MGVPPTKPDPILVGSEPEFEISHIVSHRGTKGHR